MENKTKKKDAIKIIGINLALALLLFGLVFINKTVFRPEFKDSNIFQIITGSFPNFIAALLISLCVVNPVLVKKPRFGRYIVYAMSFGIMSILFFEEIKSVWGASTQYDIYDIIGSAIGSVISILLYEYLYFRQKIKLTKKAN
jgi:glycerol uptake facilitator-like aquaporin